MMNTSTTLILPATLNRGALSRLEKTIATVLLMFAVGLTIQPARAQMNLKITGSDGGQLCLAVRDGRIANDSTLITWTCIPGDISQTFYPISPVYHIGSQYGSCIASYDNPPHAGSRVGVWQCQPTDPTQRFNLGTPSGGSAPLMGPNSLCVGVDTMNIVRGAAIVLQLCRNAPNQAWRAAAPGPAAPAPQPIISSLAVTSQSVPAARPLVGFYLPDAGGQYNAQWQQLSSPLRLDANGYLVGNSGGTLVASGAGNFVNPYGVLMNRSGSPVRIGYVISNDGASIVGNLVASGAGNLVASGAGNLVASGAGNLVATGAGNLVASGAGNFTLYTPGSVSAALSKIMVNNGANLLSNNSGTIVPLNGVPKPTYAVQAVPAAPVTGVCSDPQITKAVSAVTARAPRGAGNTGECMPVSYSSYRDLVMKVGTNLQWPLGTCRNALITQATLDVRGVLPTGSGDAGQCDARNYTQGQWAAGQWPSYAVLVEAVRAAIPR